MLLVSTKAPIVARQNANTFTTQWLPNLPSSCMSPPFFLYIHVFLSFPLPCLLPIAGHAPQFPPSPPQQKCGHATYPLSALTAQIHYKRLRRRCQRLQCPPLHDHPRGGCARCSARRWMSVCVFMSSSIPPHLATRRHIYVLSPLRCSSGLLCMVLDGKEPIAEGVCVIAASPEALMLTKHHTCVLS